MAVTILTALVLFASTACTAPPAGHGGSNASGIYAVMVVVALVAGVAMLRAVGRMFGELFRLLSNVVVGLAKLGLIAALATGAIVIAFAMLTQQ